MRRSDETGDKTDAQERRRIKTRAAQPAWDDTVIARFHQALGQELHHLALHVDVGFLLAPFGQCHSRVGHRGFFFKDQGCVSHLDLSGFTVTNLRRAEEAPQRCDPAETTAGRPVCQRQRGVTQE